MIELCHSACTMARDSKANTDYDIEKVFICNKCDYQADNKSRLAVHMRTHTGKKPFECDKYDCSAAQKYHLDAHKCSHSAARPYKCNLCNYAGKLKEAHSLSERQFFSTKCDYAAVRNADLRLNMRTHTAEKPFHCDKCDYSAAQISTLNLHLKCVHSAERQFKCNL